MKFGRATKVFGRFLGAIALFAFLVSCLTFFAALVIDALRGDNVRDGPPIASASDTGHAETPAYRAAISQQLRYTGPPALQAAARRAVDALFQACPGLANAVGIAKTASIWAGEAAGYRHHDYSWQNEVWLEAEMPPNFESDIPEDMRRPWIRYDLEYFIGTGRRPGAETRGPVSSWLCGAPDDPDLAHYNNSRDHFLALSKSALGHL